MILSHFDSDHVNGLNQLLTGWTIEWLVLPYLRPAQRLMIGALTKPDDIDPNFFRFLVEPVAYLRTLDVNIRRIMFVLPGGELPPPLPPTEQNIPPEGLLGSFGEIRKVSSDEFPEDPSMRQPETAGSPGTSATPPAPIVCSTDVGQPFYVVGRWEFCFYNLPRPELESQLERKLWKRMGQDYLDFFRQNEDDRNYDSFIRKLRVAYAEVFGRSGPRRNDISLVTYTGPVNDDSHPAMLWSPWPGGNLPVYYPTSFNVDRASLLYCGDINMTAATKLDAKRQFGEGRWSKIHVLQVPHHGSKDSWKIGSHEPWPQSWSVFSSERVSRYGHPHEDVVNDLADYSPVFVNESQGAHWAGIIEWQ